MKRERAEKQSQSKTIASVFFLSEKGRLIWMRACDHYNKLFNAQPRTDNNFILTEQIAYEIRSEKKV